MASDHPSRVNPSIELRNVALEQFAMVGFTGTSLQQIADRAGYSKSSVLYHFASKEALLEASIAPTLDELDAIIDEFVARGRDESARDRFITQFIDLMMNHRLAVYTFINQGTSLRGIPAIDRANLAIKRISETLCTDHASVEEQMRFGVALGGAAYTLVADLTFRDGDFDPPSDQHRTALIKILTELLSPTTR